MFVLGVAAALVASLLFNVGVALQGLEARAAPTSLSLRLSMLRRLLRRKRWLLGFVLGLVGVGPQVLAYATAPFIVVQPVLASGLLVLLFIAIREFHEHVSTREIAGVLAIIGGVALVAWGAPAHTEAHRSGLAVIAVVAGLSIVGVLPFAVRGSRFDSAILTVIASGCAFGATNVATKLLGDDLNSGHYVIGLIWGVVAVIVGVAATITGMTAFQRRSASMVVPVTTSIQTFLPIVFEPFFLREQWSTLPVSGVPLAAGLLLGLAGTVLTTNNRAVGTLVGKAQGG